MTSWQPKSWHRPGKTERKIRRRATKACMEYDLIRPGEKIMVAFSGGKDSYALLWTLRNIQEAVPFSFDIMAVHVDTGFPQKGLDEAVSFLEAEGFEYEIMNENFRPILEGVLNEQEAQCSLCAQMRYGVMFRAAKRLGIRKVAIGHNTDDAVETVLMNMFFSGQLKSLPPKMLADKGNHVLIRPMLWVEEELLADFVKEMGFPLVETECPYYTRERKWMRAWTKERIAEMQKEIPHIRQSILASLHNVRTEHLHCKNLHDFDSDE